MPAGVKEATFETTAYKLFKLDHGPDNQVKLTKDDALDCYRKMKVIRLMEESASNLWKEKKVRGFCHLYSGEEACAVGIVAAMDTEDAVITTYRCHAWAYLMKISVGDILSEITGRSTGNDYGKSGSMHMYSKNFYGGCGIVGAQGPLGSGIAFAMKYRNQKMSMNMAKLWNLPCLFICENNGVGMGTVPKRAAANTDYYTRGDYIPGIWVDGMDLLAVREAVRFARQYCNAGNGPLVSCASPAQIFVGLELSTYRFAGHCCTDVGHHYRTVEEVEEMRKRHDPIVHLSERVLTSGLATQDELKKIDCEVEKEIADAVEVANSENVLPVEALYADIYANTPHIKIRGTTYDDTIVQPYATTCEIVKKLGKEARF
uniref:pyruvate dehydrogenase (acetyl-transferring) n=1 Tax=Ditylenchus dipsaci TaxID=166011 RepID=A0A915DK74_9BILA